MRTRRIIHFIALLCFLPTVAGCTDTSTVDVNTDPDANAPGFLEGEERIRISGYLVKGGDHRSWSGYVSFVPPDSLRFEPPESGPPPKPATFGGSPAPAVEDPVPFTLPLDAVASIDTVEVVLANGILLGLVCLLGFMAAGFAAGGGFALD